MRLHLTCANDPGSTCSRLVPTANTTASGVRVQLLRDGHPVVPGRTWNVQSRDGSQDLGLSAEYYREASGFGAGDLEGQAILTATCR